MFTVNDRAHVDTGLFNWGKIKKDIPRCIRELFKVTIMVFCEFNPNHQHHVYHIYVCALTFFLNNWYLVYFNIWVQLDRNKMIK